MRRIANYIKIFTSIFIIIGYAAYFGIKYSIKNLLKKKEEGN